MTRGTNSEEHNLSDWLGAVPGGQEGAKKYIVGASSTLYLHNYSGLYVHVHPQREIKLPTPLFPMLGGYSHGPG